MKSNFYHIVYRDRSDRTEKRAWAIFFIIYNCITGMAVLESATYYNSQELERVAVRIIAEFNNGQR